MIAYPSSIAAQRGTTAPSCSKIGGARFWFWFALALTGCITAGFFLCVAVDEGSVSDMVIQTIIVLANAAWLAGIVIVEFTFRIQQLDPEAWAGYEGPEGGAL